MAVFAKTIELAVKRLSTEIHKRNLTAFFRKFNIELPQKAELSWYDFHHSGRRFGWKIPEIEKVQEAQLQMHSKEMQVYADRVNSLKRNFVER
ncbi:MAG TPA: hypothetical protein VL095_11465 [Flavisolibacter sp.]|nr:hypothetical protein [Flavisolibacter sp.]